MGERGMARPAILIAVVALIATACSTGELSTGPLPGAVARTTMSPDMETMSPDMDMGGMEDFTFGEPANPSEATRVIEISANDTLRFDPDAVVVAAGEIVTFRVTNNGKIAHDFVLGDATLQDEHEAEMQAMADSSDMAMSHDEPNSFSIKPGDTKEMTWRMTEAGEILMGCHQPGHYVSGMKGTIEITA